jgi:hypothetical protein
MSDLLNLELTDEQRDVLLRGLRYVRHSIMLKQEDPTPDLVETRSSELQRLAALSAMLNGQAVAQESSV